MLQLGKGDKMIEKIKKLKKVELHLHLDGSVRIDTAVRLTGKSREELINDMVASDKCLNLSEYLTKFDLPISLMQNRGNLVRVARDLVKYLEDENVIYAEVRFAPMFHTREGLSYDEVVEAVIEGLNTSNKVKTNLILCMMRGMKREDNLKTIEVAFKYLGKGVCAIDLAGAEDKYPLNLYEDLFEVVKSKGIPFTIHAGENGSYKEVLKAINLGARRIGHGIHAIDSSDTIELIKNNNVLLEICPSSNVQTNSISEYRDNPIYKFYKMGVNVSINTDNVTVSNLSISDEYIKLYNTFGLKEEDFIRINEMAIKGAFLSNEEKQNLLEEIRESR